MNVGLVNTKSGYFYILCCVSNYQGMYDGSFFSVHSSSIYRKIKWIWILLIEYQGTSKIKFVAQWTGISDHVQAEFTGSQFNRIDFWHFINRKHIQSKLMIWNNFLTQLPMSSHLYVHQLDYGVVFKLGDLIFFSF